MCPDHRKRKLAEVRDRLKNGKPVRLISTQVVEAGVDLDFPAVMRDIGPLDRVIQVAGRCNREGKLPERGRCIIFSLSDGKSPKGEYLTATGLTRTILAAGASSLDSLESIGKYFRERFNYGGARAGKGKMIQEYRERLAYKTVAEEFKLIEDNTRQIVVMNYDRDRANGILHSADRLSPRLLFRKLAPLSVSVSIYVFKRFQEDGLVHEHEAGPMLYEGGYDDLVGIGTGEERDPADLIF